MAPRAGLDRAAVVRAAAALADEAGLDGLALATLAARLGVRTPTLYHYVDGLPGLRRELALLSVRDLGARLGRAVMGQAGAPALVALAEAYRGYVKEHPGLYAASVRAPDPADHELAAAAGEVTAIVLRALAAYRLPDDAAIHVVRGLRSLVHGFATLEGAGGFGLPLDVDESFRRLLAVFIRGLEGPA